MKRTDAERIVRKYIDKPGLNEEEEFLMIEALEFLIEETHDSEYMVMLGGYYYEKRDFDLALKYYEMAYEYGNSWVAEGLGYIWYYGRTGTKDYEKAFRYYSEAADNGSVRSMIKVADMYKNGYFAEKDYDRYCEMIERAYPLVEDAVNLNEPKPEVYTRLARIRKEQGNTEEAVRLYMEARDFLAQRIKYTMFFGDLNIMMWLIENLYTLIQPDLHDLDLYDMHYVLRQPASVHFMYNNREYEVHSWMEDGNIVIRFNGHWYRSVQEFLQEAQISGRFLPQIYDRLYHFEVHPWTSSE